MSTEDKEGSQAVGSDNALVERQEAGEYHDDDLFLAAEDSTEVEEVSDGGGIAEVTDSDEVSGSTDDTEAEDALHPHEVGGGDDDSNISDIRLASVVHADLLEDDHQGVAQDGVEGAQGAAAEIAALQKALEDVREERDKNREIMIRKAADLDNYRKRVTREREELKKYGHEKLAKELLLVLDNMQRAEAAIVPNDSNAAIIDGLKMIHNSLVDGLKKFGIEAFSSVGTAFDPQKHEAIQQVETSEFDSGIVMEEYQRGYYIYDRLLRVAMVSVAKKV